MKAIVPTNRLLLILAAGLLAFISYSAIASIQVARLRTRVHQLEVTQPASIRAACEAQLEVDMHNPLLHLIGED